VQEAHQPPRQMQDHSTQEDLANRPIYPKIESSWRPQWKNWSRSSPAISVIGRCFLRFLDASSFFASKAHFSLSCFRRLHILDRLFLDLPTIYFALGLAQAVDGTVPLGFAGGLATATDRSCQDLCHPSSLAPELL